MRTLLLLALAFTCLHASPTDAAVPGRPALHAGLDISWFAYEQDPANLLPWTKERPMWAPTIGASLLFDVSSRFAVQPGVRWVRVGHEVDVDIPPIGGQEPSGQGTFEDTITYVAGSLLARFRPDADHILFGVIGAEVRFLLSAETEGEGSVASLSTDDWTDELQSTDLALVGGVGLRAPVGSFDLECEVRYQHGVLDVAKDDTFLFNWKIREVVSTVGLRF